MYTEEERTYERTYINVCRPSHIKINTTGRKQRKKNRFREAEIIIINMEGVGWGTDVRAGFMLYSFFFWGGGGGGKSKSNAGCPL